MLTWGTIALLAAWTIAFTLVNICTLICSNLGFEDNYLSLSVPCNPVSKSWTSEATDGCVNFPAMYTAAVASNVATDSVYLLSFIL
jgi:hypothetical protein